MCIYRLCCKSDKYSSVSNSQSIVQLRMSEVREINDESTPLLFDRSNHLSVRDEEASSFIKSHISVEEVALGNSTIGERLAYNDYTTIDWMHDLVRIES